jgi:hypothetical protein
LHEKEIKRLVYHQLKHYPFFKRLKRKEKKRVAKQVLENVFNEYNFSNTVTTPLHQLTGTPDIDNTHGILSIAEMTEIIENTNRKMIRLPIKSRKQYLNDHELIVIDELLDNSILNKLLADDHYTPSKRELFPCQFMRAEILKALKFPEISYRKFCEVQLNNLNQQANRTFACLSLKKKETISHSQLSTFRSSLSFSHLCNLMVYVICLFMKSGKLDNPFKIYGVDSTDLAAQCNSYPLATVKLPNGKKVRIYSELEADCGKRRNKRNKSEFFVGYRLHTLTAINPLTGKSCPIISLVAPANHHDSLFLSQLVTLAKAIGLELDIVLGDEAYGDGVDSEVINREYGVKVVTPPRALVAIPENVDEQSKKVFLNGYCEVPMQYMGRTETGHEFKCKADPDECFHFESCPKFREIPVDAGLFGQFPEQVEQVQELRDLRKNLERTFNLLKNREGLETLRARSQQGVSAIATFANMANLLIEIAGTRTTTIKENPQLKIEWKEAS